MFKMANCELFSLVYIRVAQYSVLNFEVEDTVMIGKIESFRIDSLRFERRSDGEIRSDIGIKHDYFELNGRGFRRSERFEQTGVGVILR
jgi:hypothetical protein